MPELRPGPVVAFLFALGIALGSPEGPLGGAEAGPPLSQTLLHWVVLALFCLLAFQTLRGGSALRRVPGAWRMTAGALILALGALRASMGSPSFRPFGEIPEGPARIEAWVADLPIVPEGEGNLLAGRRRTVFSTSDPEFSVSIGGLVPWIAPGQKVILDGRFAPARSHLGSGPGGTGALRRPPRFRVEVPQNVQAVEYRPLRRPIEGIVLAIRERAFRIIEAQYPARTRGFIIAMLLGDRRLLPEDIRRSMARTGTIHFLAISGLNVGMAMALVVRLPLPRRLRLSARLAFLLIFTLVTGAAPPVVRAAVMLSIHCAGEAFGRAPRTLDTLAWAALAILAVEPSWAFDVGFQLSVASVFAMAAWTPVLLGGESKDPAALLRKRIEAMQRLEGARTRGVVLGTLAAILRGALRAGRQAFLISLAASAGTAPLVLFYFYRLHPLGPVWNLLAGPVVNGILLGGGAGIALGSIHPALGAPAAWITDMLSVILIHLLSFLEKVPGSCVYLPPPPAWGTILLLGLLAAGAAPALRKPSLILVACLTAFLLLRPVLLSGPPEFQVLSVGGGSCAFLKAPGRGCFLFDCGTGSGMPGAGERIVRALLAAGVRRIDGAFLSHAHADHVGGISELADLLPLGRVWVPPAFGRTPQGRGILKELATRGIPVETLARGAEIPLGSGALEAQDGARWSIGVLHPPRDGPPGRPLGENDGSLVLRIGTGSGSILIPGDIEARGTALLLAALADLRSDVILIPHHGRANPRLADLLEAVRPALAVIGGDGSGGGGREVSVLEAAGIPVMATWEQGPARFLWNEGRWRPAGPGAGGQRGPP